MALERNDYDKFDSAMEQIKEIKATERNREQNCRRKFVSLLEEMGLFEDFLSLNAECMNMSYPSDDVKPTRVIAS